MVRLVFRPYTQIRRSICTSEPLRASTRVSSGFTLFRHSSPSFGSQQLCSYSDPSVNLWTGRRCTPRGSSRLRSLSLRGRAWHPNTRIDVRLLGPCFKTGRLEPLRQRPRYETADLGPVTPYDARSYNAPVRETRPPNLSPTDRADAGPTADECTRPEAEMIAGGHGLMPNASLSTISRTVSLSFQSTFHLSITLLVRYRSLASI